MKHAVTIVLAAALAVCVFIIILGEKNNPLSNRPATGQIFTTRSQSLMTETHFLVATEYGVIYDLHGVEMSEYTYQCLLTGGHQTYEVYTTESGALRIHKYPLTS